MVADASLTAALLAGEMPHEIEEVFTRVGLSLFPASARDLALDCTCPDQAVPCKHLAAVCYVLAERFDADPFAMLALRGRDRETLLADLRERRAERGARSGARHPARRGAVRVLRRRSPAHARGGSGHPVGCPARPGAAIPGGDTGHNGQ